MRMRFLLPAMLLLVACPDSDALVAETQDDTSVDTNVSEASDATVTSRATTAPDTTTPVDTSAVWTSDLVPKVGRGSPPDPNAKGGPWLTRLMLATSVDGTTFVRTGEQLGDQLGVPAAMVDQDQRVRVYYVDWGNGNVIAVAIRLAPGQWAYRRVVLAGMPAGKSGVDPAAVLLDDGRIRLYYMYGGGGMPHYRSAISTDGVNFVEEAGTRYSPGSPIFDPYVERVGDRWLLWGWGDAGNFLLTSSDGLNFTLDQQPFTVNGKPFHVWAAVTDRERTLIYGGSDGPPLASIGAVSTDQAATWTPLAEPCLTAVGANPSVEKENLPDVGVTRLPDGSFLMAYLAEIP